jgi:hypothetical protein
MIRSKDMFLEERRESYYRWLFTHGGVKIEYSHGKYTGEPYEPNSPTRLSEVQLVELDMKFLKKIICLFKKIFISLYR